MSDNSPQIEYFFPTSVEEASSHAMHYGGQSRFIAGGTDLWHELQSGDSSVSALIDLTRIPALQSIETREGRIEIGSAVTFTEILRSSDLIEVVPFLLDAIGKIGGVQVRNIGTLVGNITNASPAGDGLPPLYVLDAQIHIYGPRGPFSVPIDKFITDVRRTILTEGEFVTHVSFTIPNQSWCGKFAKLGLRQAMAIAVVNATAFLRFQDLFIEEARIALGAVAPTVIRVAEAEEILQGKKLDKATIERAALISANSARPIDDIRASARYRKLAVQALIRRVLMEIKGEIDGEE